MSSLKIGVFQFKATGNLQENHRKIVRAIQQAHKKKVRLLVFQECATCGYPPIERSDVESIDFAVLEEYLHQLKEWAVSCDIYIAVGTITKREEKYFNSLQVINPNGELLETYDKRALWGWDTGMLSNFSRGSSKGIYLIDGVKVGFRICFEIRFPEYFRELYQEDVKLCFVSFNDVAEQENIERYNLLKGHLQTRAVENVMTVIAVNSISKYQTAPTAVFSPSGDVICEATKNQEELLLYEYVEPAMTYGQKGLVDNYINIAQI